MDALLPTPLLTEGDVAQFLARTPSFFERYTDLLAQVQLPSPRRHQVISLTERQLEVLRAKIHQLEWRLTEIVAVSQQNSVIARKLHQWTQQVLAADGSSLSPEALAMGLQIAFELPQVTIKWWRAGAEWDSVAGAEEASASVRAFAANLSTPYCGSPQGIEAVQWLASPAQVASVALVPLSLSVEGAVAGLLVLASDSPERFQSSMGTEFLSQLGELVGAVLSRGF